MSEEEEQFATQDGDEGTQKQTELGQAIEELDYQGDIDAIRRISGFSRQTLDEQIDSLEDIDSKAISILRINVILIGLILTAASLVADSEAIQLTEFANWQFILGVVSLLLSTAVAAITYSASSSEVGIEPDKIEEAISSELTEKEFELAVAWSHRRWIWYNNRTNLINAPLVTCTTIFLLIALVHLSVGVYVAIVDQNTGIVTGISWILMVVFISKTGIIHQINDLHDEIPIRDWRPW